MTDTTSLIVRESPYTLEKIKSMREKYAKSGWIFMVKVLDQMIETMEENERLKKGYYTGTPQEAAKECAGNE